jgi:hypothetical protein
MHLMKHLFPVVKMLEYIEHRNGMETRRRELELYQIGTQRLYTASSRKLCGIHRRLNSDW